MRFVKVKCYYLLVFFSILISNCLVANDTIKKKSYVEISFSTKQMFLGIKKHDYYSNNQKNNYLYNGYRYNETYYITGLYSLNFNYNYCITNLNKRRKNLFYLGLNLNASKFEIYHKLEDFYSSSHFKRESYEYNKHDFNYNVNNLNLGVSVSYFINLKKITLIQKLGVNYSVLFYKSQTYTEDYYFYSNDPLAYPPVVSVIQTTTVLTDKIPQSNDFNPNYCIGLAYNLNNIAPFINFEFTHFGNYFNKVYAKVSLGVIIKL